MVYLSKSKYCGLWQCPKIAWLKKYRPEEITVDPQVVTRMDAGNEVGDLAMGSSAIIPRSRLLTAIKSI